MSEVARVSLVGAGPGDPELLTLKAARRLAEADVVVYDRLVSAEVLAAVPPGTARIYVGKASGRHTLPQAEINALMVRLARAGRRVVRLKGGDPLVFGRGSEEAAHLAACGVPVEVVPGITAASGCAASLGVPLTHRGLAGGVRFVTGHCREGGEPDWAALADPDTTLVFYMALATLPSIAAALLAGGLTPETPALAVANATRADERHLRTTLARLAEDVAAAGLTPPTLLIVGRVVDLMQVIAPRGESGEHRHHA